MSIIIKQMRGLNGWFYPVPKFRVWCLLNRGEEGFAFILKLPGKTWKMDLESKRWFWHQWRLMCWRDHGWTMYLYPEW